MVRIIRLIIVNAQSILSHAGIKEFRCYEVKIEESEKASSHRESNPEQPLAAQARVVLGSTPGGCWPFHFPLFSPHNGKML